jgi:hypothetical protein
VQGAAEPRFFAKPRPFTRGFFLGLTLMRRYPEKELVFLGDLGVGPEPDGEPNTLHAAGTTVV